MRGEKQEKDREYSICGDIISNCQAERATNTPKVNLDLDFSEETFCSPKMAEFKLGMATQSGTNRNAAKGQSMAPLGQSAKQLRLLCAV